MIRPLLAALFGLAAVFLSAAAPAQQRTLAVQPPSNNQRLALVIGNDDYKRIPALRNARADARAMAEALQQAGFEVILRLDQTDRQLRDAVRTFKARLGGGSEALFYFAGHGVQLGSANYLLPVDIAGDSEEQVKDDALPLQRVLDDLADQKVRFSLAIVDACRNNPFRGTGRAIGGRGLAPTNPATGQMVLYSAGAGQTALDRLTDADRDPNGLFTRVLLREMQRPGVAVDRVLRNVRDEVVRMARSVGHEQVPALYDQTIGEFYFRAGTQMALAAPSVGVASNVDSSVNDRALWDAVKDSKNAEELKAYIDRFPDGLFAGVAQSRLRALQSSPLAVAALATVAPAGAAVLGGGASPAAPKMSAAAAEEQINRAMATAMANVGYKPEAGQPGKDVVWVPAPYSTIDAMLAAARPTSDDALLDLGSGDGRIALYAALRFGVRARGVEWNADLVKLSQEAARILGLSSQVSFSVGDVFTDRLDNASIVTMFLLPDLVKKLRPKLQSLRPGTRILSVAFPIEGWVPEREIVAEISSFWDRAYMWIAGSSTSSVKRKQ